MGELVQAADQAPSLEQEWEPLQPGLAPSPGSCEATRGESCIRLWDPAQRKNPSEIFA